MNRLKQWMHMLIFEFWSAFILGRLLTDNTPITLKLESYHFINNSHGNRWSVMTFKLDARKA